MQVELTHSGRTPLLCSPKPGKYPTMPVVPEDAAVSTGARNPETDAARAFAGSNVTDKLFHKADASVKAPAVEVEADKPSLAGSLAAGGAAVGAVGAGAAAAVGLSGSKKGPKGADADVSLDAPAGKFSADAPAQGFSGKVQVRRVSLLPCLLYTSPSPRD